MAPGLTGGGSGRPRAQPLIQHFACLISKKIVPIDVIIGDKSLKNLTFPELNICFPPSPSRSDEPSCVDTKFAGQNTTTVPLLALCIGRSGDKGDTADIGIIARKPQYLPFIKAVITEDVVKSYMGHYIKGSVKRYELPGLNALNFVCTRALGGGGLASLRIDRQGKAYAQILLHYQVTVPVSWVVGTAFELKHAKL